MYMNMYKVVIKVVMLHKVG